MSKYTIEETVNSDLWDDFVDSSPQGSIYSKSAFIGCLNLRCTFYLVKKGSDIVGGISMIEDDNGKSLRNVPFVSYKNSILFADNANVVEHKKISEHFKISDLIIEHFSNVYEEYSIVTHPSYRDIRPFSWYNFHEREKGFFKVINRYTSVLSNRKREELVKQIRNSRRQELKKASEVAVVESEDVNLLNELHKKTFERQKLKRSSQEEFYLIQIAKTAIEKGFGKLLVAQLEDIPVSAVLVLYDNKTAYYQFGASHPEYRNTGASTKLVFESIMYVFEKLELEFYDFVGVNSPNRGDFKLSFNGELRHYFDLNLEN